MEKHLWCSLGKKIGRLPCMEGEVIASQESVDGVPAASREERRRREGHDLCFLLLPA